MSETIFHKIVSGKAPAYIIAEDESHLAFLDIFPTHKAQTVVIPKQATTSQFSQATPSLLASTTLFAQKVAKQIENKLSDVIRVQVVVEGFEIDYLHIKLIPAYKLPDDTVHHSGERANDSELQQLAAKLQSSA